MGIKTIIIATSSFALGAAIGVLGSKKFYETKYEKLYQEEVESHIASFARRTAAKVSRSEAVEEQPDSPEKKGAPVVEFVANKYEQAKKNYHLIKTETPQAEEDAEYEDEDEVLPVPVVNVDRTMPYEISSDEYINEFDHHEKLSLCYYRVDDALVTEDEEIIEDQESLVGNCLSTLDMQTSVWVRNEPSCIDYEIIALNSSFSESHGYERPTKPMEAMTPRERYEARRKRD